MDSTVMKLPQRTWLSRLRTGHPAVLSQLPLGPATRRCTHGEHPQLPRGICSSALPMEPWAAPVMADTLFELLQKCWCWTGWPGRRRPLLASEARRRQGRREGTR